MVNRDRGQLILVGAIAIALILLGLVLIVNTALFTQIVGSEGTVQSAKEGSVSGHEIGNSIGAVVAQKNLHEDDVSDINSEVYDTVNDDLRPALAKRSIEQSGSFVDARYVDSTEDGRVFNQSSTDLVGDWQPVTDGDVGHFVMTVDTSQSADGEFEVRVDPSSGSVRSITVDVNSAGDEVTLSSGATTICSGVPSTDGTVRIDFRHGVVYESGTCQFDLFRDNEEHYDVSIADADGDVEAAYTVVTDDDTSLLPSPLPGSVDVSDAVWSFTYEFTYDSKAVTVESGRREVDVYE